MPKISVIVPVYKAEKYIEACVSSILAQSFRDFELILVDDGSPDRSGALCDALAVTDRRVRVLHKENGSVTRSGFTAKSFAYIDVSRYQAEFFASRNSGEAAHFQREFLQRVLKYYYKTQDEAPELMGALTLKRYRRLFPRTSGPRACAPGKKQPTPCF